MVSGFFFKSVKMQICLCFFFLSSLAIWNTEMSVCSRFTMQNTKTMFISNVFYFIFFFLYISCFFSCLILSAHLNALFNRILFLVILDHKRVSNILSYTIVTTTIKFLTTNSFYLYSSLVFIIRFLFYRQYILCFVFIYFRFWTKC